MRLTTTTNVSVDGVMQGLGGPDEDRRGGFDTNPVAAPLNSRPKYVASTTLSEPTWPGTTVLTGDIAAAVGDLKARQDGELLVPGSGALVRWLLAHDLVDQLDLLTYPVVVGQGARLFPDSGPDAALKLVSSRTTARGITISTYRPRGRPVYASSTLDPDEVF